MQRVLITAGANGIGAAIAKAFIETGARVAVCDIDPNAVRAFAQAHSQVLALESDVSIPAAVTTVTARVLAEFGGLDVLVNNAGIAGPTSFVEEVSPEDWQRVLAVNLTGPFLFIRALAAHFKAQQSGCIINVSSTSSRQAIPRRTPYVASKCGLEGLSASVARELGPFGVRSNVVAPGYVDNERSRTIMARLSSAHGVSVDALETDVLRHISLRRKISMHEIGDVCTFLASERASAITGHVIPVDGNVEWEG